MSKLAGAILALFALFSAVGTAEAQRSRPERAGMDWETMQFGSERAPQARASRSTRAERTTRRGGDNFGLSSLASSGGLGPRPRQWCGWWMRSQLGGGAHLNLAWNWRHYGSPASPQVGAVVVWRGHVGMIVGEAGNGKWLVKSGNWGGRVATVARSVRGAIVRI